MSLISYVILHYNTTEDTLNCIHSIIENCSSNSEQHMNCFPDSIVIVDNGSVNHSGVDLEESLSGYPFIKIIHTGENLGFAKGNNIGYRYAKEILHADFIVILNNDVLIQQNNFRQVLIRLYNEHPYHILGPDIHTPSDIHQNPHRSKPLTRRQARKMLFVKSTFLTYFRIKQFTHIRNRIMLLENMFDRKNQKTIHSIDYKNEQENVVLLGACLIFSPDFIQNEAEAFYPNTFMYGEEDILTFFAIQKKYVILYSPQLSLYHLNGETTKKVCKDLLSRNIFTYTYIVKGCRILLKLMRKKGATPL